jgi:hypothetical protein
MKQEGSMSLVHINISVVYTVIVHAGMVQKKEESHILCSVKISTYSSYCLAPWYKSQYEFRDNNLILRF